MQRTPPTRRAASPILSPGRRVFLDQDQPRTSRRLQNQPPEFGLLHDGTRTKAKFVMTSQGQQTEASAPQIIYMPIAPRAPMPFRGEPFEDVEDWIQYYERVARHNGWTPKQCLENVYFSLEETAKSWYENHEASLASWEICKDDLKRAFANPYRRQRAEDLLQTRVQGPNETVTSFVEGVLRLIVRADPRASEEKKLQTLMKGVKSDIFGGLIRNPPTTVSEFVTEATNIERALQARASHYHRLTGGPSVTTLAHNHRETLAAEPGNLRDIIRSIIREELNAAVPCVASVADSRLDVTTGGTERTRDTIRDIIREELTKMLPSSERAASVSIAEVVRQEVRRSLVPEPPVQVVPEQPALTYAAAVQNSPPAIPRQYLVPTRREPPSQQYAPTTHRGPRKSDVWRTADNQPLCFHCGEANHVYRHCPYRELGLRGYRPNDPCPRYGQHPRDIAEYLRRPPSPPLIQRRESRSPSPRRPASPARQLRRESPSPLPRREN
ncbi:uncharacterized protein LOC144160753 [Haemaphysalis longicornis]